MKNTKNSAYYKKQLLKKLNSMHSRVIDNSDYKIKGSIAKLQYKNRKTNRILSNIKRKFQKLLRCSNEDIDSFWSWYFTLPYDYFKEQSSRILQELINNRYKKMINICINMGILQVYDSYMAENIATQHKKNPICKLYKKNIIWIDLSVLKDMDTKSVQHRKQIGSFINESIHTYNFSLNNIAVSKLTPILYRLVTILSSNQQLYRLRCAQRHQEGVFNQYLSEPICIFDSIPLLQINELAHTPP